MACSRLQNLLRRFGGHRPSQAGRDTVDPRGPVFISYRQSDGSTHAADIAWALRAAGVPVWHDRSDLPPGDTEHRLAEALESGLSGAVLLVTPEIKFSRIVREVELPELLELEKNPAFTLSVMSLIEHPNGELDFDAPDQLLKQARGTLRRLNQTPARKPSQKAEAAHAHCRRRMQAIKEDVKAVGGMITLDVQTRVAPSTAQGDADLILRLRPPIGGKRLPHRQGLEDLRLFLAGLPQLLQDAGARHTRLSGGAHLSSAYALGAALPTTLFGRTEVIDTEGRVWTLHGNAPEPEVSNRLLRVNEVTTDCAPPGEILVYLDLRSPPSNTAFDEFVAENEGRFARAFRVCPIRAGNLNSEDAEAIIGEASQLIRKRAGQFQTTTVHLLLRCPWPVAFLLGRALNTIRARLYEWEDNPDDYGNSSRQRYLPSLVVRSGAGCSPIEQVSLPK